MTMRISMAKNERKRFRRHLIHGLATKGGLRNILMNALIDCSPFNRPVQERTKPKFEQRNVKLTLIESHIT